MEIVTKALEYYDDEKVKHDNFLSKIKYYNFKKQTGDLERSEIYMYDENKKKIFSSKI